MSNPEISLLMQSLKDIDQSDLFKKSFDYVRNKTNQERITIGQILYYFNEEKKGDDYKFTLGFTAIAMLKDKQQAMNLTERDLKLIIDKILEDMC